MTARPDAPTSPQTPARIEETHKALHEFKTSLLAIVAEIETQIPSPAQP